jgi:triosephosphate isomerase
MKNLVIANWKMNPVSKEKAKEIFKEIKNNVEDLASEVVVCPPFIYLSFLSSEKKGIILGAQDVFFEEKGSFTGEISPLEIKDLGVEYVIVGHSERRKLFNETDEQINKKIKKSLEVGLNVILCVGETEEEKNQGKTNEILEKQIKQGLSQINDFENINIAYEPVWAIGTGNNCSVDETKNSINFIRQFVKPETRILYGGSVKSENSADYIEKAGANGLLVGRASLDAEEFVKIVKSVE